MTGPGPGGEQPGSYQVPPAGYYPMYPPARRTNVLAILALVLSFVVAPAGIVLGHLARGQIRRTGEDGDGLALAGLIIGYVFTAINLAVLVLILVLIGTGVLLRSTSGG